MGNKGVDILIDGGSSKNLINSQLCKDLNLTTLSQEPVVLQLPNGGTLISQEMCPDLKWIWNGVEFSSAAHVVDLSDRQIILGIEWLSQLGDVNCNYQEHAMQFQWKGQHMTLSPQSVTEISSSFQLSVVTPMWMEQIITSYEGDAEVQQLITEFTVTKHGPQEYYMQQGLLKYKRKWVTGATGELRKQIFEELHSSSIGGHSGRRATLKRIREYFYWPTINQSVGLLVRECSICQ